MKLSRADEVKIEELSKKYGIDVDVVRKIVSSPYDFIQKKSKEIVFNDDLTKEQFEKKKTNFNIPGIGKLYASYFLYSEMQKKKKKN